MKKILKIFLSIVFIPFYLIVRTIKSNKRAFAKIPLVTFQIIFLIPIWLIILMIIYFQLFGGLFASDPFNTTGTSMLPTLKNGEMIFTKPYPGGLVFRAQIKRGDIVVFSNAETNRKHGNGTNFIKRVIALPGEDFEIREGFVFINGKLLNEPYILTARSTYGGVKIAQCQKIKIPENKLLVLGDNRKLSSDSREIGLISISDINAYLHLEDQIRFKSRWRDSSKDKDVMSKSSFIPDKYIEFLNQERERKGLKALTLNMALSQSAKLRAEAMLKFNDLGWNATISGYPMWRSMADARYSNVTYGEFPLIGYFTADELIAYEKEHQDVLNFFMKKDYQDIGISTFVGDLAGCPTEIIVQQVAGYIPPNYKQSDIDSWKPSLAKLQEILPSWEKIKDFSLTYNNNKHDADRLIEIINYRIGMMQRIIAKMESRQWLNNEENNFIKSEDMNLFNEQEGIAKKLNSFRWQH